MKPARPKVAAIVGPTAVGKTAVSLEVAERLDAEIVSVDSMQTYRGMDIGTAKATRAERERVAHHLVDLFEPSHELTVAEYQQLGRSAIADISDRGRLALLVGGSGLYFRAIVDDLSFPPRSETVRSKLESEVEELGTEALFARLEQQDPKAASKIEPGNARRIVRALEVIELTGRPFSDNATWDSYESLYDLAIAGLRIERSDLYDRIRERTERMLAAGFADEVRSLDGSLGRTARQALGYRQLLDLPEASRDVHVDAIAQATKRYARRQGSWFSSDPRVVWFDASSAGLADDLVTFFRSELALP